GGGGVADLGVEVVLGLPVGVEADGLGVDRLLHGVAVEIDLGVFARPGLRHLQLVEIPELQRALLIGPGRGRAPSPRPTPPAGGRSDILASVSDSESGVYGRWETAASAEVPTPKPRPHRAS